MQGATDTLRDLYGVDEESYRRVAAQKIMIVEWEKGQGEERLADWGSIFMIFRKQANANRIMNNAHLLRKQTVWKMVS